MGNKANTGRQARPWLNATLGEKIMNKTLEFLTLRSYYQIGFGVVGRTGERSVAAMQVLVENVLANIGTSEEIPEFPGVNVYGVDCSDKNRVIYVGEALSDKTGLLRRRIRDEVYEGSDCFSFSESTISIKLSFTIFESTISEASCIEKKDMAKIRRVAQHFERSGRKKGTTHIVWSIGKQ